MTQAQPPAGWYPDPQDATQQRYWDGNAWTGHTAPSGAAAAGAPAAPGSVAPAPAGAPAWSVPMAPGMGDPSAGKTPWYKRKIFLIPVAIVVVLIVIGAIVGTGGDHSNGLEKAIETDGQQQFQANLSQTDPGATVKITSVDCVEKGDTQEYTCLIRLTRTEASGQSQNYIGNAVATCDNKSYAHCVWHTTGEPQPTAG